MVRMKKPKPPCYKCVNRKQGCHSECEKYIFYVKTKDFYNELIRERKENESWRN